MAARPNNAAAMSFDLAAHVPIVDSHAQIADHLRRPQGRRTSLWRRSALRPTHLIDGPRARRPPTSLARCLPRLRRRWVNMEVVLRGQTAGERRGGRRVDGVEGG